MDLYTAITVPFINGKVDMKTLYNHILMILCNKSNIILFTEPVECLTDTEKYQIMDYLADNFVDEEKKSFVVAINGNTSINFACETLKRGFTNIMISSEHEDYIMEISKQLEVYPHFKIILDCYTNPLTIQKLYNSCKNIFAIKGASYNLNDLTEIRKLMPAMKIYFGDDLVFPFMGDGLISIVSNLYTKEMYKIMDLCAKSDFAKASAEYNILKDFIKVVYCENNSSAIQYALLLEGIYKKNEFRLPLSTDNKNKVTFCINQLKPTIMSQKHQVIQNNDCSFFYSKN